jgi:PAS domain S-box-containing protein
MMEQLPIHTWIVNEMAEGVIFLDQDDIIRICNPAAEKIRNVCAERIIGRPVFDIHPPASYSRIRDLLASLKSGAISSSNRVIHTRGRYFENSYSAIRDLAENYLGTLLISRDITERKRLADENLHLKNPPPDDSPMIAGSPVMRLVVEMTEAVAPLDSTVLVTGENGTGKELVVERIHRQSLRREKPLVRVNCAALPESLIESELFGYARGAFTGAVEDRQGKFELAHGGTLFLDEIGEIPLASQAKLLRAIQEKGVQPVGARKEIQVDVRIVAATNRNLTEAVERGTFREDLFYRLNVITIDVPPLRERQEDILPLAEYFLDHFCRKMGRGKRLLSPAARALLLSHHFPGNVRQLRHAMERAVALGKGELILPDDLPADLTGRRAAAVPHLFNPQQPLRDAVSQFERDYIVRALSHFEHRKLEAARALGISRKSLWEKINRHDLNPVDVTEM